MDESRILSRINSYGGWRHRIEVAPGVITPGISNPRHKLQYLHWPEGFKGQRVLDIGTSDGFFAFEAERRGAADVVGIDVREPTGFEIAKDLLGSHVRYSQQSLFSLSDKEEFDAVLFIDVLYHLTDPYGALAKIAHVCTGDLYISTLCLDLEFCLDQDKGELDTKVPPDPEPDAIMQFLPGSGKYTTGSNFWSMTSSCLARMLNHVGFEVEKSTLYGTDRISIHARKPTSRR